MHGDSSQYDIPDVPLAVHRLVSLGKVHTVFESLQRTGLCMIGFCALTEMEMLIQKCRSACLAEPRVFTEDSGDNEGAGKARGGVPQVLPAYRGKHALPRAETT